MITLTSRKRHALTLLLQRVSQHPKALLFSCCALICGTLLGLFEPRLFGYAIDHLLVPKNSEALPGVVLLYFATHSFRFLCQVLAGYGFAWLGQEVMQTLRCDVFRTLQSQSLARMQGQPIGKLVTRVTYDIASLSEVFSTGIVILVGHALLIIGTVFGLLLLDWKLACIALSVFPIIVYFSIRFTEQLHLAYRDSRKKMAHLTSFFSESLSGIQVIQLFSQEQHRIDQFQKLNETYSEAQVQTVQIYAYFQPMITFVAGLSMALAIASSPFIHSQQSVKIGILSALFAYILSLYQPIREIADKWNLVLSGMASAEKIFDILEWKGELEPAQLHFAPSKLGRFRGEIIFENVWFSYGDPEQIGWSLKNFNLHIHAGQKVGLVGHSGAGKSTVIQLLMRFSTPQKGRILLDGVDIQDYPLRSYREQLGLIQQDVMLFSGSIRDNVLLGQSWTEPNALTPWIQSLGLQDKLDRTLQEGGKNLSQGERQALSFARAVAQNPSIWLLDEATSSIDSQSEQQLTEWLETASRGQTALLIAHRLSTLSKMDRVLTLDHGTLIQQ